MRFTKKTIFLALFVALFSAAPFIRAVDYGIVNCDDYDYVSIHQTIPPTITVEGIRKAFSEEVAAIHGIWMPLTFVSYMLDGSVAECFDLKTPDASEYGPSTANIMHLQSIILHAISGALLFLLLHELFGGTVIPMLAALLWSIHPLRCESVVWIASRKDVLSGVFLLAALLFWTKGSKADRHSAVYKSISFLSFIMAGMSKPSVMTFPLLAMIIDVLIVRKIRLTDYVLPLLAAALIGLFAAKMQAAGGATNDLSNVPLWGRILNAAASIGVYAYNMLWPSELAVQCMHRWPEAPRFLFPGIVVSSALSIYLFRQLRHIYNSRTEYFKPITGFMPFSYAYQPVPSPVFAGLLWFAVSILPMLGIANFGYHAYADRFTYIPMMGVSIAICALAAKLPDTFANKTAYAITGAIVLAYGCVTWNQTSYWRSDLPLWERTLEVDGENSAVAHASLALYHFEITHDLDKHIYHFRRAKEIKPMFVEGVSHIHEFALCEKRLLEDARVTLKDIQEWSMRQNDILSKNSREHGFLTERKAFPPYMLARIAYFITTSEMKSIAESELAELAGKYPDNPNVLYLQARLAEEKGESSKATAIYEKISSEKATGDYVQFRYLRNKGG